MEVLHLCAHFLAHSQEPDSLSPGKLWGCSLKLSLLPATPAQETYWSRAATGASTFPQKSQTQKLEFFQFGKMFRVDPQKR